MIIGTHNSMSYLRPAKWWMRPLKIWAQCQSIDFRAQLYYGVRYFDLRIRFKPDTGMPYFCHGLMEYDSPGRGTLALDSNPYAVVRILSRTAATRKTHIFLRLMLENMTQKDIEQQNSFSAFIETLRREGYLREDGFLHVRVMEKAGFRMIEDRFPTMMPTEGTPMYNHCASADPSQIRARQEDDTTSLDENKQKDRSISSGEDKKTIEEYSNQPPSLIFYEAAEYIDTWWKFLLTPRFFARWGKQALRMKKQRRSNPDSIISIDFL